MRLLTEAIAPRGEPGREEPRRPREADEEDGLREPLSDLAREVRGAAQVEAESRARRLPKGEGKSERLVGHEPVDPERGAAVEQEHREDEHGARQDPALRGGLR